MSSGAGTRIPREVPEPRKNAVWVGALAITVSFVLGVDCPCEIASEVSIAGEKLQTAPFGSPVQVNDSAEAKPFSGVIVTSVLPG